MKEINVKIWVDMRNQVSQYAIAAMLLAVILYVTMPYATQLLSGCNKLCISNVNITGNHVSGYITLDGKPLENAAMKFTLNGDAYAVAYTGTNGNFSLYAPFTLGNNMLVGSYIGYDTMETVPYYGEYYGFVYLVAGAVAFLLLKKASEIKSAGGNVILRFSDVAAPKVIEIRVKDMLESEMSASAANDVKFAVTGLAVAAEDMFRHIATGGALERGTDRSIRGDITWIIERHGHTLGLYITCGLVSVYRLARCAIAARLVYEGAIISGGFNLTGNAEEFMRLNGVFLADGITPSTIRIMAKREHKCAKILGFDNMQLHKALQRSIRYDMYGGLLLFMLTNKTVNMICSKQ